MFGLLTPSPRTRSSAPARFVSLHLEKLEERLSPTAMNSLYMNVTYNPNQQVTLTGQLWGQDNAGQTITFSGAVTGTATTDAQGVYRVTLKATQLGQVNAVEANGQSNLATFTLESQKPVIANFMATAEGNGVWMFSGTVTGPSTQGEVVNLGSIPALEDKTVNVNPDGSFTVYATVTSGNGGVASAQAVDWWGEQSDVASSSVPV